MSTSVSKDVEGNLKPQKRLMSFLLSKNVPPLPTEDERIEYPEFSTNIIARILFWWLQPVMYTGYKRTLEKQDLFTLPEKLKVDFMVEKFTKRFTKRLEASQDKYVKNKCKARGETLETTTIDRQEDLEDYVLPRSVIIFSIFETWRWQYFSGMLYLVLANVSQTTSPLLSKKLIKFVEDRSIGIEAAIGKGVGYAIGVCMLLFITGILINHYFYNAMMTGAQVKAVLTKVMLTKSFKLSAGSKHKYNVGKITSMMGTDLSRIDFSFAFTSFLFTFPIPVAIAIAILIVNIGPVSLIGVGMMFGFMFLLALATKSLFEYRKKANSFTDSRVNYIKEVLNNLKMIKFYSWEPPYEENISEIRRKEMRIIRRMQFLRNFITAFSMSLTLIASMVVFLVLYAVKSKDRDAASIFSSMSLFNTLTQQVIMVPLALATGSDAFIGLGRVGQFLIAEEEDEDALRIEASEDKKQIMEKDGVSIDVEHANFEWEIFEEEDDDKKNKEKDTSEKNSDDEVKKELSIEVHDKLEKEKEKESESDSSTLDELKFAGLTDINFTAKKGEFIVLTGLIGSGKSSLLSALSGFMKRTSGKLSVNGSVLLCGYPWVQNATVKENILFGTEFDAERYDAVIYACSLESDLEILPAGDNTEIGERGITLSGGQKARINLARAVYANKDIILLDDVLSAVDAKVGKHIMSNCILGLLKDKTRVLATHQLSLIGSADRIIYLNGDGSVDIGTFEELSLRNANFANLMQFSTETKDDDDEETQKEDELDDEELETKEMIKKQLSKIDDEAIHKNFNKNIDEDGKLTEDEQRAVNRIKFSVYQRYIKLGAGSLGYGIVPLILLFVILSTFCQLFTNTWLSFWTEYKFKSKSEGFYIGFYIMFCFLAFIFLAIQFIFMVYLSTGTAVRLNIMAFKKVLLAPMAFMDVTPTGRILNRFTKDTDVLDNEIGDQLRFLFYMLANIIGVLILCIVYLPWFAIAVPFLILIFIAVADYYQGHAREVKRLEAILRSFVYNNFNEVLSGLPTIKAYKHASRFLSLNAKLINDQNEAYYISIANQRWLAIQLDVLATIMALIIAFLCIFRVFSISAASVGLLLSYVLQIAGQLSMVVRMYTQVENEMNSVERLCQYAYDMPSEAAYITEVSPPQSWPEFGLIKFDNVSLAYRPGLPLVLKNINVDIKANEKIGICGRTGAGKSSIMTALYRLSELDGGRIWIDGVDTTTIGLKTLRTKLSIIPQDPILFKGSIRSNLDPFEEHNDDVLWDALRRSGLIPEAKLPTIIRQEKEDPNLFKFHLLQTVEDDGSNFSLGEKQLIAFARALVRNSKILILDEATSSVDYETDTKVQATIKREFDQCTILCIAHRLKTIINYDKILVLDKGEVQEYDTPLNLFNQEDSIFRQMCEKSSITAEDF